MPFEPVSISYPSILNLPVARLYLYREGTQADKKKVNYVAAVLVIGSSYTWYVCMCTSGYDVLRLSSTVLGIARYLTPMFILARVSGPRSSRVAYFHRPIERKSS